MLRRASASLSSQVCARRVLTRAFCAGPDFTSSLHWWKNGKDEDAFTGGKPGGLTGEYYTSVYLVRPYILKVEYSRSYIH